MNTVIIQIGNTDNKLTQQEWAKFCDEIHWIILDSNVMIHFSGGPPNCAPFQNYCWVIEIDRCFDTKELEENISYVRAKYKQDNVAITYGETKFI